MSLTESLGRRVSAPRRRAWTAAVLPASVVGVLLLALVPLSTLGGIGAGLALAVVATLLLVTALGVERTAVTVLALGIALSPLDNFRPVGALAFASLSDLVLLAGLLLLLPVLLSRNLPTEWLFVAAAAGLVLVVAPVGVEPDAPGAS